MKKIQIEKIIKKFDEFEKDEQEEILNNYRDINVDFDDWNDYIIRDFIEEVKEKTDLEIEIKDILWDVGSRYSKFGVYSKNIVNQLLTKFEDKGAYDIETIEKLGSFLNHLGGGMCNQNHTEYGLAKVYFDEDKKYFYVDDRKVYLTNKEKEIIKDEINEILDIIISLCSKYHNKNEEVYNYNLSDESVKKTIEINDYDFDSEALRIY
jgi:hypothetical protein